MVPTTMTDAADMNSTPVSKLFEIQPPATSGGTRQEVAEAAPPSYAQILEHLDHKRPPTEPTGELPPVRTPAREYPPQEYYPPQEHPRERDPYREAQEYYYRPRYVAGPEVVPEVVAPRAKRPKKKKFAFLRPALIVAIIVFFVLRQGAPQIARLVPLSVDAATGKFTVAGLVLVSGLSGGAYLGITELFTKVIDGYMV